jgi:hypothetical protein
MTGASAVGPGIHHARRRTPSEAVSHSGSKRSSRFEKHMALEAHHPDPGETGGQDAPDGGAGSHRVISI